MDLSNVIELCEKFKHTSIELFVNIYVAYVLNHSLKCLSVKL